MATKKKTPTLGSYTPPIQLQAQGQVYPTYQMGDESQAERRFSQGANVNPQAISSSAWTAPSAVPPMTTPTPQPQTKTTPTTQQTQPAPNITYQAPDLSGAISTLLAGMPNAAQMPS